MSVQALEAPTGRAGLATLSARPLASTRQSRLLVLVWSVSAVLVVAFARGFRREGR
jgi:hypothetical protein